MGYKLDWIPFYPDSREEAWMDLYPDPRDRVAAMELLYRQAGAYDPCAVECDEMSSGNYEVLVIDRSSNVEDIWVSLWLAGDEIQMQWDDRDYAAAFNDDDWWRVLQLGDEEIVQKAFNAVEDYMVGQGLIYRLPDGTWAEAEPY